MLEPDDGPRPRRRRCRRPRFATEAKALYFAREVMKEPDRTAYGCSAHVPPAFHLRPRAAEKALDTPTTRGG